MGTEMFQTLFGLLRLLLVVFLVAFFCSFGAGHFHGISAVDYAQDLRFANPFFAAWPDIFLVPLAAVFHPAGLRYGLAPLIAMLAVLTGSAMYVRDIYALPSLWAGFRYVLSSMFATGYPRLRIDQGVPQPPESENSLILQIGGPGEVIVEPDNAALFRHLRERARPVIMEAHFLAPFEQLAYSLDLNEQQSQRDEITGMTRDGIQIVLRDVHFRYRVRLLRPRTPEDPFPFDLAQMNNMIANLSATSTGIETWIAAVERIVVGQIIDFIAANSIDYLTAPARGGSDPRGDLMRNIFPTVQSALRNVNAELLWVDTGHIEVVTDIVNERRTTLWASAWVGESNETLAYGSALRQAYRGLGRAQAQAELILSITEALSPSRLGPRTSANIRRLLLARTAQVLDALSSREDPPGKES
jgi:hypothetical protein